MKSYGQLWDRIVSEENVRAGWLAFRRHHARELPVMAFERKIEENLRTIRMRLADGTWRPAGYHQFRITDPKPRVISCAPVKDRVVHHALCNVTAPLMERRFVDRSFACREGYGSHLACRVARELAGRHTHFLKMDVRHYFDTIDQDRLMGLLSELFREKPTVELFGRIVRQPYGGRCDGKGLPIGNLTSQWFANLYLDGLDHAVMEGMGVGGRYLRYMDDILVFADGKAEAWGIHDVIRSWLITERGLAVKDEMTLVAPVKEGVPFLGLRIYRGAWRFRRSRFVRARRSLRKHVVACRRGDENREKLQSVVRSMDGANSWYGFRGIVGLNEEV